MSPNTNKIKGESYIRDLVLVLGEFVGWVCLIQGREIISNELWFYNNSFEEMNSDINNNKR